METLTLPDCSLLFQENRVRTYSSPPKDIYEPISHCLENHNYDPFFIVNLSDIFNQFILWKEKFHFVTPYYAMKCNPNPVIIKFLSILGCGFDCASREEIAIVKDIGLPGSRIIYANPCKESGQIQYARSQDVDRLVFDDVTELYKIKLYHPYAELILRIQTEDASSMCAFSSKFGLPVDTESVRNIISVCKALDLNLVGISFHAGSGAGSTITYHKAIKDAANIINIANSVEFGFRMYLLDIGGGFPGISADDYTKHGIPIGTEMPKISFHEIAKTVHDAIQEFFPEDIRKTLEVIAEPGRFFVAKSHTLCLSVIAKKERRNLSTKQKEFIYYMNDGIYGSFNCIYFDHAIPKLVPYNERDGAIYTSKVFGPTCDSIDLIVDKQDLPELAVGEWCFVPFFGAYTAAAASTFNGFRKTKCYYIFYYNGESREKM